MTGATAPSPEISQRFPGAELWALAPGVIQCNHGSFGGVPQPVRDAQAALRMTLDANPTRFFRRELAERLDAARQLVADHLHAERGGFVFVRNVTEGVSVVLASFRLDPGDEIVVTDHAYGAVRLAVVEFARRAGARVVDVALPHDDEACAEAVRASFTARTRLLVIDHVAAGAGRVLPVAGICAVARAAGVATLVDAAHSPGMVAVDVDALQCDFWTGNFHKWMCAPPGAGGLWVAPRHRATTRPLIVSHWWADGFPAAFLRYGTEDSTAMLCVPAAITCLAGLDSSNALRARNHALAAYARDTVASALGTAPVPGEFAWMGSVWLPDGIVRDDEGAVELQTRIAESAQAEVSVNRVAGRAVVRMSAFLYNRTADYDAIAERLPALIST